MGVGVGVGVGVLTNAHEMTCLIVVILQRDIYVDQPDYHGNTALHLAAGSGHVELVKLLVQGGAQVNLLNNERELPLDLARLKGHVKVSS